MMPLANRNHDYSEKIVFFPNWCDDILKMPMTKQISFKGDFVIMMAGNIADGIGLPYLIPVLEKLKDNSLITCVFVGGGAQEQDFRDIVKEKGLDNVVLTGQEPFSEILIHNILI